MMEAPAPHVADPQIAGRLAAGAAGTRRRRGL